MACRISGPGAAASAAQSTSSARTSATVCDEPSGRPAYVGTAVDAGRPGTISKITPALATALTSASTESTDSGSPATSRTTSEPEPGLVGQDLGHLGGITECGPDVRAR